MRYLMRCFKLWPLGYKLGWLLSCAELVIAGLVLTLILLALFVR